MALDTSALIAAVVRNVLEQLEQKPGSLASVLAPADEQLALEVGKRLGDGMQVHFQDETLSRAPELYVIPELSCSDMADLAVGRSSNSAMSHVLDLLLQGKDVRTLGYAYRSYADTASSALLHLYEEYAATLASYGLTELPPPAPETVSVRHAVVTAEHVTAAAAEGACSLRVPYRAVVTPLAEEVAANHNLIILKNL